MLQVDHGQAKEGLISVGSTHREEADPLDPEIIQRLDNKFSYRDIPEDYYTEEDGDEARYVLPCVCCFVCFFSCESLSLGVCRYTQPNGHALSDEDKILKS